MLFKKKKMILIVLAAALTVLLLPLEANAAVLPVINFENDSSGAKLNGWSSNDSAFVKFSDTLGSDLIIENVADISDGQSLMVYHDDNSGLQMNFSKPMVGISFEFGNDDPVFSSAGDQAVLTLYKEGTQVGQVSVEMNHNDLMDQTIAYSGVAFDKAVFIFDAHPLITSYTGCMETVDNILLTEEDKVELPVVNATVDIKPQMIMSKNLNNRKPLAVSIKLPGEYAASDINEATLQLLINNYTIDQMLQTGTIKNGRLTVKFDRQSILDALAGLDGTIKVVVEGQLNDGTDITGSDFITVK